MAGKTDSSLSPPRTPASGTVIMVRAGGQTDIDFDFINDNPDSLGDFYLRVEGQPAAWAEGVGEKFKVSAAPLATGILRLTLKPPVAAEPGQYAFQVKTMSEGISVGHGPIKLILNVEPAELARPAEPVLERPEHADASADNTAFVTPGVSGREQPPDTAKTAPVSAQVAPISEPRVEIAPSAPAFDTRTFENAPASDSLPRQRPNSPGDNAGSTPKTVDSNTADSKTNKKQEDRLSNTRPPSHDPPPAQNVKPIAQNPAPFPSPISEPVPVLVNPGAEQGVPVPGPNQEATETGNEEPSFETETNVLDPLDGAIFKMRPGETLLLRFKFTNQTPRTLNYVLDESDPLAIDWTERVRENVNLTRGLQGEVALRLKPPLNATPGDYPFGVTVGPQGTQVLPRAFTLTVLPTPAVRLLTNKGTKEGTKEGAKEATVKGGPFSRSLEFQLTVDSVGNSDTAFRIAVKAPHDESVAAGIAATEAGNLYETPQWRFLFDKEMDNLKSPSRTLPPRPVNIRLRAQFKDAWWWGWGFQDRQQMQVEAVPVTDITNGGKRDNTVTLTAVRNRYLPFPAILLLPLCLLFMLLMLPGPSEVSLENPTAVEGENVYWVVAPPKAGGGENNQVSTTVNWEALWFSPLRLTISHKGDSEEHFELGLNNYKTDATVGDRTRPEQYTYRVSRWIGGADKSATVNFIASNTETPLLINGEAVKETTLVIPRGGKRSLVLSNGATKDLDLSYWAIKVPDLFDFGRPFHREGKRNKGEKETYTVSGKVDGKDADDQDLELITTDANHPHVIIHLKLGEKGGR